MKRITFTTPLLALCFLLVFSFHARANNCNTANEITRYTQGEREHAIGHGKPFCFIQISDPQIGFNDKNDLDVDLKNLDRAVGIINKLQPRFVVCTGDMAHRLLNDADADIFMKHIKQINKKIKVYFVPGNHDISKPTPEFFSFYQRHYGKDRFSFRHNGCAFIGINSTLIHGGESEGENKQYVWLEKELKKARKCRMRMVFSHIPLVNTSMDEKEEYFNYPKAMRTKYMDLFKKYNVCALMCGHLHKNALVESDGIEILTTNALSHTFKGNRGMTLIEIGENGYKHAYISLDDLEK